MVTFKNETEESHGLLVKERIDRPAPQRDIKEVAIPGRDGSLYEEGKYNDIAIKITFNYISKNEKDWPNIFRKAKQWLRETGDLFIDDDPDFFYKVKKVEVDTCAWTSYKTGEFTVTVTCDPYNYSIIGQLEIVNPTELYNQGDISRPVYTIIGEGNCTLTVNGKTLKANVGQQVTIDTDLKIAYRIDNSSANTTVIGKYDDLVLVPGRNTISISSGFVLKVIPGWRYA